jgi:chromosomal replication initiator protein
MQGTITDGGSRTTGSEVMAVAAAIAERIGSQKYRIWFQDCTRLELEPGRLKVGVRNPFLAGWLEGHFLSEIRAAAASALGSAPEISFVVAPELSARRQPSRRDDSPASTAAPRDPVPGERGRAARAMTSLRLTLETFVVGPSNELAYNAAHAVVREKHCPYNPLFIHGGCGVGKTHLLQGICNGLGQARPDVKWLYLSAEEFANQFVLALKTKKLEAFRSRMRQTDLLAIDDIHFLANKPSTQEEFLHTFNTISLAGKQVVLVSDAHPKMIGQLSDKLVNRFVSGMVVKIEPPDFETRCRICRQYLQKIAATGPEGRGLLAQPALSESIICCVAEHMRGNVRELEGALVKLTACAALHGAKLTLPMAQAMLTEHVEHQDPMFHAADIESTVGAYFGVTPAQLHSAKRSHTISLARHFAMYLTRTHTNMSSSEIGRHMGNKNHATVLAACSKVQEQLARDESIHWQAPHGNKRASVRTILAALEDRLAR